MDCLKSRKDKQSIRTVLLFQNATIFTFYYALNTIKGNFKVLKKYDLLELVKDNILTLFRPTFFTVYHLRNH